MSSNATPRREALRVATSCLLAGLAIAPTAGADSILIRNVQLFDATGAALRRASIVVEGELIAAIQDPALERPAEANAVIDGRQLWAIPGLWDAHVHLANRPDSLERAAVWLPALLAHGVVGVRDMGGDWELAETLRAQLESGAIEGPEILTPGPFVDAAGEAPNFLAVATPEEARAVVQQLSAWGVDFVKIQAGLTPDSYGWVVDEARTAGLAVAGHVPEAVRAIDVIAAGQLSVEHVSPALPGDASLILACSARETELREALRSWNAAIQEPEPDRDRLRQWQREIQTDLIQACDATKLDALAEALRRNHTAVVPTLIWSQTVRPLDGPSVVPAGTPLRLLPSGESEDMAQRRRGYVEAASERALQLNQAMARRSLQLVGALHAAGVTVLAGTDSFDGFVLPGDSLHREIGLLVAAGLDEAAAIRAASSATTRALGIEGRGTVEVGRRADIVLVGADPTEDVANLRRIHAVIKGGRHYSRAALDRLLDEAAEKAAALGSPAS